MPKARMRDLVIVLPGITGSVLEKDGRPLWAASWGALGRIVTSGGRVFEALAVRDDDPLADDLGDGITATGVIETAHLVPGLVKIDGYTALSGLVTDNFAVIPGDPATQQPANFFRFPYDWRRDLRATARQLGRFVAQALPRWQEYSGAREAKVVVLAHSMGGLIARYWLEVEGGWRDCRALITLGTPHRGSVQALSYLVNGYRKLVVDLTEAMRSMTSVHQLLPIYPAVLTEGTWRRVAELEQLPGVDQRRAAAALAFHREIEAAVNTRHHSDAPDGYALIPVIGTAQRTWQSATLSAGELRISRVAPHGIDPLLGDGDGTVPRVSAIPIELSTSFREIALPERHSSLQNSRLVLNDLRHRLMHMQVTGLHEIRGPGTEPGIEPPGMQLDVEDAYLTDEPVTVRVRPVGDDPGDLDAMVVPADGSGPPVPVPLARDDGAWAGAVTGLAPGVHRLAVSARFAGPGAPHPVHDLFEVLPR